MVLAVHTVWLIQTIPIFTRIWRNCDATIVNAQRSLLLSTTNTLGTNFDRMLSLLCVSLNAHRSQILLPINFISEIVESSYWNHRMRSITRAYSLGHSVLFVRVYHAFVSHTDSATGPIDVPWT